jgi:hypothetical protein
MLLLNLTPEGDVKSHSVVVVPDSFLVVAGENSNVPSLFLIVIIEMSVSLTDSTGGMEGTGVTSLLLLSPLPLMSEETTKSAISTIKADANIIIFLHCLIKILQYLHITQKK